MNRDPFYQQIVEKLKGPLDPQAFEIAAVDLLRSAYPGLAAVVGGSDSGMDGAVGDGDGEPYPLVTTTSKDAIGNLTRNLKKFVEDGFQRRKALFATSRRLTPRRRQNLHRRAGELGFVLSNIHDQQDFAARLYRDPQWCQELLGLSGDPLPLSIVPRSVRPFFDQPIVGRDKDIDWLRALDGDGVIVGQPGCGKTYLLQRLVMQEQYGLFVVTRSRGDIAAGIRAQQPTTIIVDDAHVELELLRDLIQLRRELSLQFKILATSWPGAMDRVADILGAENIHIRLLDLLSRDEIVQVVEGTGLVGPVRLVAEIVNQAEGRPGLAVTLANMCKLNSARDVLYGDVLGRQTVGELENLVGPAVRPILAAHAIGGDAGLPMGLVADTLNLRPFEAQEILSQLAAAGVLLDQGDALSVRPPTLRYILVRDVFFGGATSLPEAILFQLMEEAPVQESARTLFGARSRGGRVPFPLVAALVERTELWEEFAWAGPEEVRWLLEQHPEKIVGVAEPALAIEPMRALPLLLAAAVGDNRTLHNHPRHPLRLVQDWARASPAAAEALRRREQLHQAVLSWKQNDGDPGVAARCVSIVFDPGFDFHEADPGSGMKIQLHRGPLTVDAYERLHELWPDTLELFGSDDTAWRHLIDVAESWYFARIDAGSKELYEQLRTRGLEMLEKLAAAAELHPGIVQRIRRTTNYFGDGGDLPADPVFDALFPLERPGISESWEREQREHLARVQSLAKEWAANRSSEQLADELALIAREQQISALRWPDYSRDFCAMLASEARAPDQVASALMQRGASADHLYPFLNRAVRDEVDNWGELLDSALELPNYVGVGILVALTSPDTPSGSVTSALERIGTLAHLAESVMFERNTPPDVQRALLQHQSGEVCRRALAAAFPRYENRELAADLMAAWKSAFVGHARGEDDWMISRAVEGDPELACDWLKAVIEDPDPRLFMYREALIAAVKELRIEERRELIQALPETYGFDELAFLLVGDDDDLFADVLRNPNLSRLHLVPFQGKEPDEAWQRKAKLALEVGYTPDQIARALTGGIWEWTGNESDYWQRRIDSLEPLLSSTNAGLREIAGIARASYLELKERAEEEEREEAIYGKRVRRR